MPKPKRTDKPRERHLLGAYFPDSTVQAVDALVKATDTDRSKFIRCAVREKIAREAQAPAALAS